MVVGFLTRRVPPVAAKAGLLFFIICYALSQFVIDTGIHFLHVLAMLFVVTVGLMLLIGWRKPMQIPFVLETHNLVEVTPWKYRRMASIVLTGMVVALYWLFSKGGLAG